MNMLSDFAAKAPAAMGTVPVELIQSSMLGVILYGIAYGLTAAATSSMTMEDKRFWRLTARNIATASFVIGLGVIWRAELQAVLVALGAAAAGFLIGFKEQWQSMLAFWVRVVKRPYALNDFIEVDGVRGRVIDITWLTTTLAEMGPSRESLSYTGRVVHVPNVRMITANLTVDNLTGSYSVHTFSMPLPKNANALKAEDLLLKLTREHCAPYLDKAVQHMKDLQSVQQMDTPGVEPRARLAIGAEGAITIVMRMVVPAAERARVEQAILHDFLRDVTPDVWPPYVPK